jgi:hypothetical protein
MFDDYWVAIIIITIVGFLITIALSFYFIFIPASRAEEQFDTIAARGRGTLSSIQELINTTVELGDEFQQGTCESLIYITDVLFNPVPEGDCFLQNFFNKCAVLPEFCYQYGSDCT